VLGGLSILGTSGIVRPLSHQAYKETIEAALSVARAAGRELVLSTGGKSERFARRLLTTLPEECFVQIADFFGFSVEAAVKLGFTKVTHSVFIGKLVKMAMGLHYTHASSANMDLGIRHALEIMQETRSTESIIPKLSERAMEVSRNHSQGKLDIYLFLFDYNGQVIFKA
jgi:cobalt-precorrin-5B (C1)-methyltransferase